MKSIVDQVLRYIVKNYPIPEELTKTRTTKLVYLVDWEMAKRKKKQLTNIQWKFDHFGPFVSDVYDAADKDKELSIVKKTSAFGTTKYIVQAKNDKEQLDYPDLDSEAQVIIDEVIDKTKNLYWNGFIEYVYDTYPIKHIQRYNNLDLVQLANEEELEYLR
ncbi:Panacea domain-containing protein [Streptococcus mutans]|uniref:Panacea domain-containing protein n=1 Tax=Streptococcus mutans TaxID=1309 RepID=UPI0028F09084|nr:Panacea domain-containing protein [Streptococcus mutans]MDT9490430.1 Panacea domain-containing protein [Streptococcus mutans]